MALTDDQALEFLDTYGIEVPEFLVAAVLEMTNSRNECLEANYGPAVVTLIQSYLLALFAVAQGGRLVTSQRAVNGASRSFQYKGTAELWRGMGGLLRKLDTKGCVTDIMPEDPSATAFVGMWVGKSNSCMGGPR